MFFKVVAFIVLLTLLVFSRPVQGEAFDPRISEEFRDMFRSVDPAMSRDEAVGRVYGAIFGNRNRPDASLFIYLTDEGASVFWNLKYYLPGQVHEPSASFGIKFQDGVARCISYGVHGGEFFIEEEEKGECQNK